MQLTAKSPEEKRAAQLIVGAFERASNTEGVEDGSRVIVVIQKKSRCVICRLLQDNEVVFCNTDGDLVLHVSHIQMGLAMRNELANIGLVADVRRITPNRPEPFV